MNYPIPTSPQFFHKDPQHRHHCDQVSVEKSFLFVGIVKWLDGTLQVGWFIKCAVCRVNGGNAPIED